MAPVLNSGFLQAGKAFIINNMVFILKQSPWALRCICLIICQIMKANNDLSLACQESMFHPLGWPKRSFMNNLLKADLMFNSRENGGDLSSDSSVIVPSLFTYQYQARLGKMSSQGEPYHCVPQHKKKSSWTKNLSFFVVLVQRKSSGSFISRL